MTAFIGQPLALSYVQEGTNLLLEVVPKNITAESKSAAENTKKTTKQAIEAEKLLNQLRNTEDGGSPPADDQNQRREMQRLIDTTR